ncbi:OmpA family protein [Shewanella subflava]|uniref:OmpA family protein n=1 Tax=Shewanella subflava TaxID=2986476 RepID=A0ABT3I4I7_9GAMM|nr:OmpA family protein [Shewanella subflava]MCW3170977.1 OmpA family protein [Shewanella subflava]
MRYFILLFVMTLSSACSMNDIIVQDQVTKQKFDLNDDDRDGVIVARERCVETLTGSDIDNYGCGAIKNIAERQELKILFANNSYYIEPQYYPQIEKIATMLKQYPSTTVVIEGHTSNKGSYELNLALSQNRATAVTNVLRDTYGIEQSRLKAIGYSFDRLIDTSGTPAAERVNRRVIAEITGEDTASDLKWNIYTVDQQTE